MPWILEKLATSYSSDSVESVPSDELTISSSSEIESSSTEETVVQNQTQFENELSTGLDIDILSHPNLSKLPELSECGNIPSPKKINNEALQDSEESDEHGDIHEDEDEDDDHRGIVHQTKKRMIGGRVSRMGWIPFFAQIYERDGLTLVFNSKGHNLSNSIKKSIQLFHILNSNDWQPGAEMWGHDYFQHFNFNCCHLRHKLTQSMGFVC